MFRCKINDQHQMLRINYQDQGLGLQIRIKDLSFFVCHLSKSTFSHHLVWMHLKSYPSSARSGATAPRAPTSPRGSHALCKCCHDKKDKVYDRRVLKIKAKGHRSWSGLPCIGGAMIEKLQPASPPLLRTVVLIQGIKEDTRVNTSG